MSTKESVIEIIRQLPDNASVSDIMSELFTQHRRDEKLRERDTNPNPEPEDARQKLVCWCN